MRVVEIILTGVVPDDDADKGHEAVFLSRDPVQALARQLAEIGLLDVQHTRRLINSKRTERKGVMREPQKPMAVKLA